MPAGTMENSINEYLLQAGKPWILYGLQLAAYALKPGGLLYVLGAKDRGILSAAKHMQETFGNVETLALSKGQRVVRSRKVEGTPLVTAPSGGTNIHDPLASLLPFVFADAKLDAGTLLFLTALSCFPTHPTLLLLF